MALQVENPRPGDTIAPGKYIVAGRALETSGATVDRVQIFIENRSLGGIQIGEADLTPSENAPSLAEQSTLGTNGRFTVLTDTSGVPSQLGPHTLFAYARSAATGQEASLAIPIVIGAQSGGYGASLGSLAPTSSTNVVTCAPPAPPSLVTSSNGMEVTSTVFGAPPISEDVRVLLDSPSPGALITTGRFSVSGRASTSTGAPIDRVQVFLGSRDLGGQSLGEITTATSPLSVPNTTLTSTLGMNGVYNIIVTFPGNVLGTNTVFVYARASGTGKEGVANTSVTISR